MAQIKLVSPSRKKRLTEEPVEIAASTVSTDLGWMAVAHRGDVLLGVVFGHDSERRASEALRRVLHGTPAVIDFLDADDCPAAIRDVIHKLERYAEGEHVDFCNIAIDESHLTTFGRRVVAACRRIPAGQTRSYGQLASVCDSPGAARAVGSVMAKNRYPVVVPCHRVVGASGSLGGFSAPQGLAMKRRMLALEEAPREQRQESA